MTVISLRDVDDDGEGLSAVRVSVSCVLQSLDVSRNNIREHSDKAKMETPHTDIFTRKFCVDFFLSSRWLYSIRHQQTRENVHDCVPECPYVTTS